MWIITIFSCVNDYRYRIYAIHTKNSFKVYYNRYYEIINSFIKLIDVHNYRCKLKIVYNYFSWQKIYAK